MAQRSCANLSDVRDLDRAISGNTGTRRFEWSPQAHTQDTEDEKTMMDNDPVWETFVLLAHAYGPTRAHSLTSEEHGVGRAIRYPSRFIVIYGRRCCSCGAAT